MGELISRIYYDTMAKSRTWDQNTCALGISSCKPGRTAMKATGATVTISGKPGRHGSYSKTVVGPLISSLYRIHPQLPAAGIGASQQNKTLPNHVRPQKEHRRIENSEAHPCAFGPFRHSPNLFLQFLILVNTKTALGLP